MSLAYTAMLMAPETESEQPSRNNIEYKTDEEMEPRHGMVPREIDVADDEHPIASQLGESTHRKLSAHEGTLGESFAFRYSKAKAYIREYIANAETGVVRRGRLELNEFDPDTYDQEWFDSHTVVEMLDEARNVCNYYPVIETHEAPDSSTRPRFEIDDNGIGIAVHEFAAMKELGLSPSSDFGSQSGNFGQGIMSCFNAIGKYGEGDLITYSRLDEANYKERFRITGFNDLPGTRDHYGTTWSFPSFCDEAADMDIEAAIEEYTEALKVPVIHHVYDENGIEQYKEEFTPTSIESFVDDDRAAVTYHDECFEAIASPSIGTNSSEVDPKTFLVSMPIERDTDNGLQKFNSPFHFHVRITVEDGRVYRCSCDDVDHTGLVPVENKRYENELIEDRGAIHPDQCIVGDLVAYLDPETGTPVVPDGVDDGLVSKREDCVVGDPPGRDGAIDPTCPWDAVVIDGPHEGAQVVTKDTWDSIPETVSSECVPRSEINETALSTGKTFEASDGTDLICPEPVDDRDRLAEHDNGSFRHVADKLREQFESQMGELLERLDSNGFNEWFEFSARERDLFLEAFEDAVGSKSVTDTFVGQKLSEVYGVHVDPAISKPLSLLSEKVEYASSGTPRPNLSGNRSKKYVRDVLQKTGSDSDVYMGATIHAEKAKFVWELDDDNSVVAVDGAHEYQQYAVAFGWKLLKDISLYNISDKYDLDQSTIEQFEREGEKSSSGSGGGVSMDELEASSREIKVRWDTERKYKSTTASEIVDVLDPDTDDELISRYNQMPMEYLLVIRETEVNGVQAGADSCLGPVYRTVVPNYVADYFEDVDRALVCDGKDTESIIRDIQSQMQQETIETLDIDGYIMENNGPLNQYTVTVPDSTKLSTAQTPISDCGSETTVVVLPHRIYDRVFNNELVGLNEQIELLLTKLAEDSKIDDSVSRIGFAEGETINKTAFAWESDRWMDSYVDSFPTVVRHRRTDSNIEVVSERWRPLSDVDVDLILPESVFDRDADEWSALIAGQTTKISRYYSEGQAIVDMCYALAERSDVDQPTFPSQE